MGDDATQTTPARSQQRPIALRDPQDDEQRRWIATFESRAETAEIVRFAAYHDDRLDAQVREGRFGRVVFANVDAFMTPVWKGYFNLDEWARTGVQVELLDAPSIDPLPMLLPTYRSWSAWHRTHRRRQALAASILGALTLAAMGAMIWIIPRLG
jgi:hypothetical protein